MAESRKASAKSTAKKAVSKVTGKRTVSKKLSSKKVPAKKAKAPKTESRKSVPSKTTSKTTSARKATAKKTAAKKAAPKKATARKAPANKTVAKKAAAGKAPAKKAVAKKAAPRKATSKKIVKSKLPKKFVDQMKARLIEERAKYLQTAEDMRAEADSLFADREPGDVQFDEESGEGDTLAVERERGLALSTQAQSAVQQIDEALERIAAGTYGICVVSGEPIPRERLEAIPWAAMTVQHKVGGLSRR